MIKNYFFLNRFIFEASEQLKGSSLNEAFSQDKDKIILSFQRSDNDLFLEISTNPGLPYINLRQNFHRAKKNTLSFFADYLPAKFIDMSIAKTDRVIKITLSNSNIFFAIRGKYTNVVIIGTDKRYETFKKYDEQYSDTFIEDVEKLEFTPELHFPSINESESEDFIDILKNNHPYLGKEIFTEFKVRYEYGKNPILLLKDVINDALTNNPDIIINAKDFSLDLLPETFHKQPYTEIIKFNSVIDSFNFFIQKHYYLEELKNKSKLINRFLSRELNRLSSKLNNLKAQLEKGSSEEKYNKLGNLLLINLISIKKGMKEIEVDDIYSDSQNIKIKLDPLLAPKQNTDRYFEKARNEKIRLLKSTQLYDATEKKYSELLSINKLLDIAGTTKELNEIMKKLNIKQQVQKEQKEDISKKFKQYLINNKYRVYVGKDSTNNDLLTTKFAKQNDFWFHARSVSGSHVVLRVDNTKEPVPKDILKKAASLAAFHSKAKTAGLVPVSYCLKKYVVKKKSMPVGQVILLREQSLLVRPEVPDGCEYLQNDTT
jgi:predicted ribosome quality control (RQC) complex YloA/Tae2 family protein